MRVRAAAGLGHKAWSHVCIEDFPLQSFAAVLEVLPQPVSWHCGYEPRKVCCMAICMPHMLPSLTAGAAVSRWSAAAAWQLPHTYLLTTILIMCCVWGAVTLPSSSADEPLYQPVCCVCTHDDNCCSHSCHPAHSTRAVLQSAARDSQQQAWWQPPLHGWLGTPGSPLVGLNYHTSYATFWECCRETK